MVDAFLLSTGTDWFAPVRPAWAFRTPAPQCAVLWQASGPTIAARTITAGIMDEATAVESAEDETFCYVENSRVSVFLRYWIPVMVFSGR